MSDRFANALTQIHAKPDNSTLLKLLCEIRDEVHWPKNKENITKLRLHGCLKVIVGILQSTHRHLVDYALSILGNSFMDKECTREAVTQHNILSALNQLLKRSGKEDGINGRVFRILGNICQHRVQWSSIIIEKKPQIVTHIVELVRKVSKEDSPDGEKISAATITMAIRCLRNFLNSQTLIALVQTLGVLKAVGALFIKYSLEWQRNDKQNEAILNTIIRLLQEYSRFKFYHSILEMRNTERGDSLIHLSNVLVVAPKRIVKIVMNFLRISQLKSELPIVEICDRFIEVLDKHSIMKEFNDQGFEYLQCLCYLLDHPANRNSERCGKCLPLLIKVLDEFQQPTNSVFECCILLIATLNKCRYDDRLMLEQIDNNIINILIDKLSWLVGSSTTLQTKHKKNQNKTKYQTGTSLSFNYSQTGIEQSKLKYPEFLPSTSDDEVDFLNYKKVEGCCPSPCSSNESDLPWSSPSTSPRPLSYDVSDSDDYSPVCSESDNTEFPLHLEDVTEPTSMEVDRPSDIEDNSSNKEPIIVKEISLILKINLLAEILRLIKILIKIKPPVLELGSPKLLILLLKFSGKFHWTYTPTFDTISIICRILESHVYLLPLMQSNFVQDVYKLTDISHNRWCVQCRGFLDIADVILSKLCHLAESGVGKGDIAHILLRGSGELRQQLVLVIPYIVRNKHILSKLMLNCGGIEVLMKLLREDSHLRTRSIMGLCAMASRQLEISDPKGYFNNESSPETISRKIVADRYKEPDKLFDTISFKLDDASILNAKRDLLCEKSEFFSRLMHGSFKESTEDVIGLQNVQLKSFKCLLHLLKRVEKNELVDVELDLDTLLDVISLSDRFLMMDLSISLTNSVEKYRISAVTVPAIYRWSIESGTNLLRVECIAFALVGKMLEQDRFVMFKNLFELGYSEQLTEDIQQLLVRYLAGNSETGVKRKHPKADYCRIKKNALEMS